MPYLPPDTWICLLSEIYEINISNKLDSIDIDFRNINFALENFSPTQISILNSRFGQHLSLVKTGASVGLSREHIRSLISKTLRSLRHPTRLFVIQQNIVAYWNLNIPVFHPLPYYHHPPYPIAE